MVNLATREFLLDFICAGLAALIDSTTMMCGRLPTGPYWPGRAVTLMETIMYGRCTNRVRQRRRMPETESCGLMVPCLVVPVVLSGPMSPGMKPWITPELSRCVMYAAYLSRSHSPGWCRI